MLLNRATNESQRSTVFNSLTQNLSFKTMGLVTMIALVVVFMMMYLHNVISSIESPIQTGFISTTPNANMSNAITPQATTTNTSMPTTVSENIIGTNGNIIGTNGNIIGTNGNIIGANGNIIGANGNIIGANIIGANGTFIEKYSPYEDPTDAIETYDTVKLLNNLNSVNATLYVADNCKFCTQQADTLGESKETLAQKINVVNCVEDGVLLDHCKNIDISGFPTWECNGNLYTGAQSVKALYNIVAQNQ